MFRLHKGGADGKGVSGTREGRPDGGKGSDGEEPPVRPPVSDSGN